MKRALSLLMLFVLISVFSLPCAVAEGYTVTLTPRKSVTLKVGETAKISVSVTPVNLIDHSVVWLSENEYIASVSQKGVITAHAAGQTTVRAIIESGDSATLTVKVTGNTVKSLSVKETNVELTLGSTFQMEAIINENADDKRVKWFTDDDTIATVDSKGVVTAVGYGTALITVLAVNGMTAQATVYVPSEVTNILIDPATLMISPGDSQPLDAYVFPGNARNRALTWETSDASIARVDENGVVKAIREGACSVRATAENGVYAISEIIVTKVPSTLSLSETEVFLTRDLRKASLTPVITPRNAEDALLTWTSSNENVVLVESGNLVAAGYGDAVITVTSQNGLTAECLVSVGKTVLSAAFEKEAYRAYIGSDAFTPDITFEPAGAKDKIVSFEIDNPLIATVDETGSVQPKNIGKTTLRAMTAGGIEVTCGIHIVEDTREISFALDNYILTEHTSQTLTVNAQSDSAVLPALVWESSIPSVCAVIDGTLYAQSEGATVITARTEDGALKCMCTVTVIDNPTVETKVVALTFDNGPGEYIKDILSSLDAFGVQATFFLLGKNVSKDAKTSALLKDTVHEIGNHTYENLSLNTSSVADISKSLARTDQAIVKAIGREATVLRAPDANLSARLFATFLDTRPFIGWTAIIPDMVESASKESVTESVLKNASDQAIIVLHDSSKATSDALYDLLKEMILSGYRFVTVSELRSMTGDTSAVFTTKK